jgi:alanine dehydrogenase
MKIGIIREGKKPADKRTPLSPLQCNNIINSYPEVEIYVQSSPDRCIKDSAYEAAGIKVTEDISNCDILVGIKEVNIEDLIPNKTYLFFSHTIKKQTHNRALLRDILRKNITLIDYETLVWDNGSRILGFGRFAGIVGGHNGLKTWLKKNNLSDLKAAWQCKDYSELVNQYAKIKLPNMKICLTGDGRVSHGVIELFEKLNVREVTPRAFIQDSFDEAVYVHLRSEHYYEHKDHKPWDKAEFYHNPEDYYSTFKAFTRVCDLMVNGIFWHAGIPSFFTKEEMKDPAFRIKVIADISCDIPGSIPCTLKSTTIEEPVYGYHPFTEQITEPYLKQTIDMMTVGNLPCELPLDASLGFGEDLMRSVLPLLLGKQEDATIARAAIAKDGKLTDRFKYLSDYIA